MLTSLKKLESILPLFLKADVPAFLHSSPGIGKSALCKQVADTLNLKLIDIRLTDMEPTDIVGLPNFVDGKSSFVPFDTFPLDTDEVPEGYEGWLIVLDEFNSAHESVMAASYKLILDRMVGQHKLHPNCKVIACGNMDTDNAIVNPLSSALISRFAHFYIEFNFDDFMDWAAGKIDVRFTSFFNFRPALTYNFNPDTQTPYSCPRTIEKVSDVFKGIKILPEHKVAIASLLGDGVAAEFMTFTECYKEIATIKEIIADPNGVPISDKLGVQWAMIGVVAYAMNKSNYKECITFLQRLPLEMQTCALREIQSSDVDFDLTLLNPWKAKIGSILSASRR